MASALGGAGGPSLYEKGAFGQLVTRAQPLESWELSWGQPGPRVTGLLGGLPVGL